MNTPTFRAAIAAIQLLALPASAAVVNATFNSATDVPVTAATYTATGNTVNLSLGFSPPTGTNLTVVNNTGLGFISGQFSNLAQGQMVDLSYGGKFYRFVTNYYGGTGNDLVLQWAYQSLAAWGDNSKGQLGNNSTTQSSIPVLVTQSGVLAGKNLFSITTGGYYCLALCSDGTVAAWGDNSKGQLGNNSTTQSNVPVLVTQSGVLAGKTVISLAAGYQHSLALCSDGTLAAWGNNSSGQLGYGITGGTSSAPVLVKQNGVLAGKTVVSVAAGQYHSVAVCSDGTAVAWGYNGYGQLGNNSTTNSNVPVLVTQSGVLAGKTVVSVKAGANHSLALCSDGTVASWGQNIYGQLGNNSTTASSVPVLLTQSGVLLGKTVVSVSEGWGHSLALCTDGTLAAWGDNSSGQMGNNSTGDYCIVPVLVTNTGVLSGKTLVSITAGNGDSLALCSDGTVSAWGNNSLGQLGNNSMTSSSVPVLVTQSGVLAPQTVVSIAAGQYHTLAMAAEQNTSNLFNLTLSSGTLNPTFSATTTTYTANVISDTITVTPITAGNMASVTVNGIPVAAGSASQSLPLVMGSNTITTVVTAPDGASTTAYTVTVTRSIPSTICTLSSLILSSGTLSPTFSAGTTGYTASVSYTTSSITVTPTVTDNTATIKVNGTTVASGAASGAIALSLGTNVITIVVTAQDGTTTSTYTVTVTRPSLNFTYTSALDVPVTSASYNATGNAVNLSLGFSPPPGTNLTVVNNTGLPFITGQFSNLAQGQVVDISYGGKSYRFVANYYGGTGNDLVLQWAYQGLAAWGRNNYGQLGNNSLTDSSGPLMVRQSGVLAGKTVVSVSAGAYHSLALCSDGTVAAWGYNTYGQLGNNSTTDSSVPVLVTQSGVLAGKTVVSVAAGGAHSLTLCSDGTVAAWGYNYFGGLGNNSTTNSSVPVQVTQSGVLAGKSVVSVAAGSSHSLALCSDGTVAAWGYNGYGGLGNNSTTQSKVPVLVTQSGVLAGKKVISLAAGSDHNLVLCSDGTLVAWGNNYNGELGNNSMYNQSNVPVLVTQSGVLAGKSVVSVAAGYEHCLALCSDGTVATWGNNRYGELGNNTYDLYSSVPVLVTQSGVLSGKSVVSVAAKQYWSSALCSDGTVAAWGDNSYGQLGNNSTTGRNVPVLVAQSGVLAGKTVISVAAGGSHCLALAGVPNSPDLFGLSLSSGTLSPSFDPATTVYITCVSEAVSSITVTPTSANISSINVNGSQVTSGLASQAIALAMGNNVITIVVTAPDGISTKTYTVTVARSPSLSALVLSTGTLNPAFDEATTSYVAYVGNITTSLTITPTVAGTTATVTVNGVAVTSGTSSTSLPLVVGSNMITVLVTAQDGITTRTYTVEAIRPDVINANYTSAGMVPISAPYYYATGNTVNLSLGFAPPTGTNLTVVNNTGIGFINGQFSNLAQGQVVILSYGGKSYGFVANYYGGTGNDLVLQWAYQNLAAWGLNSYGQLGNNSTANSTVPVLVTQNGTGSVLAGKTLVSLSAGQYHSLALCSDNTIVSWGYNANGQLGNNSTNSSSVPVMVNTTSGTSALYGKTVVSVAAGDSHSLALCSDGTVAAWGSNSKGQLGNGSTTDSWVPVSVTQSGVLAGKTVVSVSAGYTFSLALCSDGTVAAWGYNYNGQLGNNSTTNSSVPVLVTQSGVLLGKTVASISAGGWHSLALCSDGTVAGWGWNMSGQLGNSSDTDSWVPVLVTQSSGGLTGKTVISVAAGSDHSLALCSDGTVAAWGYNGVGQLGNNSVLWESDVPVLVTQSGVLAGKNLVSIAAGRSYSLALCSDGTVAAWGDNPFGQLGNNSTVNSSVPVLVTQSGVLAGKTVVSVAGGYYHSLALAGVNNSPDLSGLSLSAGTLSPSFDPAITSYGASVSNGILALSVTPTSAVNCASISVNGSPVTSGSASQAIPLVVGSNAITIVVTAPDGVSTKIYTVTVTREGLYTSWINANYPGLTGANALPTADPDGDGLTNLQEYAFGGDPTASTSSLQYTGTFAGGGTITRNGTPITRVESITNGVDFRALFIRRKDFVTAGLTYTPQFSADLTVWQNSTGTPVVLADDGTWQVCSVPYPLFVSGKKAKFFRISVSIP